MKQLILMVGLTLAGTAGVVVVSPFLGVAVYYLFAVLRPQFLWKWSLPPDVSWSYYVALATILAALGRLIAGGRGDAARPAERSGLGGAHLAVLAFGIWVGVSYVMARDRLTAYPWFVEYVKIFVMFAASALLIRTLKQVWALAIITALALAYIAYEVNYLYFANNYLGIYHNGYGGVDNNGAGLMLAMGVPMCFFAWEGLASRWRWGFLALIPMLLHAVLMTYSRGAMVSLLAVTPLIWLRSRNRKQITPAIVGLLLLVPVMAGPEIRARFFSIAGQEKDASAQSRFQSWSAGWNIAKDNPVFGVGIRNANLFSYQYGADLQGRTIHNQYIQIAADSGFVGLGLYLTALGAVWWSLRRVHRDCQRCQEASARATISLAAAVECALAIFCLGSAFLSLEVFELPYLVLLLGAQLGVLVGSPAAAVVPQSVLRPTLAARPA